MVTECLRFIKSEKFKNPYQFR